MTIDKVSAKTPPLVQQTPTKDSSPKKTPLTKMVAAPAGVVLLGLATLGHYNMTQVKYQKENDAIQKLMKDAPTRMVINTATTLNDQLDSVINDTENIEERISQMQENIENTATSTKIDSSNVDEILNEHLNPQTSEETNKSKQKQDYFEELLKSFDEEE